MAVTVFPIQGSNLPVPETKEVELRPELQRICACESVGNPLKEPTHYAEDGSVLRGRINPKDIGICQINLDYHEARAKELGLDLFKEEDNITFANLLYEKSGPNPWFWSRECWK